MKKRLVVLGILLTIVSLAAFVTITHPFGIMMLVKILAFFGGALGVLLLALSIYPDEGKEDTGEEP